jgi:hypothetical protein
VIRINLAKPHGSKKGGRAKRKSPTPAFILFIILLLAGGGYYVWTTMEPFERRPVPAAPPPPAAAAHVPVPREETPAAAMPSSQVRTNMAENVVREIGGATAVGGRLGAPYAEMTTAEKINYEVLFGRNVFDMITRCTPPGIRFRSLEIQNFQAVYLSGAGVSRNMVQEMFSAYMRERGELMPKPYSNIKDDPGTRGSYNFTITHKPHFSTAGDPFQALDHIGFRDGLQQHLRAFSSAAGENNFKMSAAPAQISVERAGIYRRVTYRAAGMSTYKDFQGFVLALYNARMPVAFKTVSMTPVRDEQVRVTAEILFTVKE